MKPENYFVDGRDEKVLWPRSNPVRSDATPCSASTTAIFIRSFWAFRKRNTRN